MGCIFSCFYDFERDSRVHPRNNICLMKISKDENIVLYQELFVNEANYNKFAPYLSEFIKEYVGKVNGLPATLWPSGLAVNDSLVSEFELWLKSKGVVVQLT